VDLSILTPELVEERFEEDFDVPARDLDDLVPSLERLIQSKGICLVTRVDVELDTRILEDGQEAILPESAGIYLGTASDAPAGKDVTIFVSYSTHLDVWLRRTWGPDRTRLDNSIPSELNYPRLTSILCELENRLGVRLHAGDSDYYRDFVRDTGFDQS
jgi:hypothetical protein